MKRKYLDVETLKQHLFMEATLGYLKTLADVNRVIDERRGVQGTKRAGKLSGASGP